MYGISRNVGPALYVRTILFGPSDIVREKTGNDVVVDGGAVVRDGLRDHFGDVYDVSGEEAWIRAGDALTFHQLFDAPWCEEVATNGVVYDSQYQGHDYHEDILY